MKITDAFVIPPDVQLIPVSELDEEIRGRVHATNGDYALARPRARIPAKLIDPATAALLRRFLRPAKIVDAVVDASRELGENPERMLDAAYPLLKQFIRGGLLVSSEEVEQWKIDARHRAGDVVCGCVIQACLHVLDDTEVYTGRSASGVSVVLKLARAAQDGDSGDFEREARALARLEGTVAPRLVDAGVLNDRPYLVMEWRAGVNAERAAGEIRRTGGADERRQLGALACAIADAYAALHLRGVVHGDVHHGNVLVDRDGRVTLVDFGKAIVLAGGKARRASRAGYSFHFEPEFARAHLADEDAPQASAASDQYALAAMLYELLTGTTYLDFALEEHRAFQQIATERMLPFAARGTAPWPRLEAALERALEKSAAERFPSVAEFAHALHTAVEHHAGTQHSRAERTAVPSRERADALESRLRTLEPDGELLRMIGFPAPTASVMSGAAGIAYGLARLAQLRNDPALLSLADTWSMRGLSERRRQRAFYDGEDFVPGIFGRESFHHGTAGPQVVRALIAHAMGDLVTMDDAMRCLRRLPAGAGDTLDFTLGVPGTLVGLSLVLEAVPDSDLVRAAPLRRAGAACARAIERSLDPMGTVGDEDVFVNFGIAHGWAGALYALMRWHEASRAPLAPTVARRLDELAARAEPVDRAMRWPWRDRRADGSLTNGYMAGWCNGSAGFVHFWLTAHSVVGDRRHLELAEAAGWDAFEDPDDSVYDLCCGTAGRSYALLALYRATGDDVWLRRARSLADDAMDELAEDDDAPPSLYKGWLGPVLLAAEIDEPHLARMPLFECEGWPACPEDSGGEEA
jgi:serine/threonine-protein kinase